MRILHRLLIVVFAAALLLWGCAPTMTREERIEKYGPNPPVIEHYGAAPKVSSGRAWRVYLAAQDPDGDMDRIDFELDRPGYVTREDRKKLSPESAESFSGRFFLSIPIVSALKGRELLHTNMVLRCTVVDKAGNKSKPIGLPFQVVLARVPQEVPESFEDRAVEDMGPIMIRFEMERRWGKPIEKD
jgi:hypothetical protein